MDEFWCSMSLVAHGSHRAKDNSIQCDLNNVVLRMMVGMVPFMKHSISFSFKIVNRISIDIISTRKLTQSERAPLGACHYDLDLWPFDPKIYRCFPFFILHLCMKYEFCRSNTVQIIALQRSVDTRTDGQTDRQTDRQSDYYRAPASSMAGP